jgi:hypothetical protein
MQLLILFLPPLLLYISAYHLLVPVLADRADVISIRPELPSPQLLLHLRARGEYLSGCYALYYLHYLLRAVHRHTLHQEMDMVFVCSYLQKRNLIPLTNFQADLFELEVYFGTKYNSSILRWTDNVIQKYRNIMALMNEATHSYSILSQQAAGN